jgi:hypothetical protein
LLVATWIIPPENIIVHPINWNKVKLSEYRKTPIKEAISGSTYETVPYSTVLRCFTAKVKREIAINP